VAPSSRNAIVTRRMLLGWSARYGREGRQHLT
jgi:hypothetical protein